MPNIPQEDRDKLSPVWDMSQERAYSETLLGQRFNFFLVFFSLTIAGAVNARSQVHLEIVLALGAFICGAISITIISAQVGVNRIFAILFKDKTHPVTIVHSGFWARLALRNIIGFGLPIVCSCVLTLAAISAFVGALQAQR